MKQYIVDAFTGRPFSGNPAAVCVMDTSGTCRHEEGFGICCPECDSHKAEYDAERAAAESASHNVTIKWLTWNRK